MKNSLPSMASSTFPVSPVSPFPCVFNNVAFANRVYLGNQLVIFSGQSGLVKVPGTVR